MWGSSFLFSPLQPACREPTAAVISPLSPSSPPLSFTYTSAHRVLNPFFTESGVSFDNRHTMSTTTQRVITELKPDTVYQFRVASENNGEVGDPSGIVEGRTKRPVPSPPFNLQVSLGELTINNVTMTMTMTIKNSTTTKTAAK